VFKGFYSGCEDVQPKQKYVVHGGEENFPLASLSQQLDKLFCRLTSDF